MILNELKIYLKKHKLLTMALYLQLTLFFIIIGTFISFIEQLNYESNGLQQIYEGKSIYQLLDGYYDGEEYQNFVSQPGYLERLKSYYNELDHTNDFDYLAMFNHHILLKDNGLPNEFIEGYEQGNRKYQTKIENATFTAVKSFQMNKQALDFFGLVAAEGTTWSEHDFKGFEDTVPVLLGASYRNVLHIGDETTINFYNKSFNIRIIGFLKENSKLYFNNDTEFYLDKYILLPYREYDNKPTSEVDELFQQAVYFAMINGYIVTDNDPSSSQSMMQRINAIAQKSSIGSYSFIGLNPHFLKYRGLMTVLQEDKTLVQTVFLSTALLNLIIIIIILFLQQKKRLSFFAIHYINGATKVGLIKMQWIEIFSIILAAYVTSFIVLDQILKIGDFQTQFIMFLICISMSIIICLLLASKLLFRPIMKDINIGD
ncbi:hypothetical protein M3650_12260 [Paenibacillus sp. MER TA 81-3]|uniref:hypothetical protein n=1 Tax=Paenibacillus sp. MER TA 81-3 TaxID=2939573 RepID=UPI00203D855C|nr:hypothetical protein [Paenibacillus sp. MER TA 81-3]MCM3339389.1 hypothetical protein [Paenibacillus sp. MER TA 81-3]